MTSLYPDTSEIFYSETDKPKKDIEESEGLTKHFENDKGFRYFSYLIKKAKMGKFMGEVQKQTLFIPVNQVFAGLGDDYFIAMCEYEAMKMVRKHIVNRMVPPDSFELQHYFVVNNEQNDALNIHNLKINERANIINPKQPLVIGGNIVYLLDNLIY